MKDTALATFELTLPREFEDKTGTRVFTALSGVHGPVRKLGRMTGRDTIVFEVFATQEQVHFLISFRPNLAKTVESLLTGVVRTIRFEESTVDVKREWTHVIELSRHSDITKDGDTKPRPVDPKMVEVLLRSVRNLQANEAVMIQWVMTPVGNIVGDEDGGFWAVGRLAASGHDIPAKAHIGSVLSAYRSLQVFAARRLPKQLNHYVNERRAPVTKWPGTYRPEELAVMCGLPIGTPQVPGVVLGGRTLPADSAISSSDKDIVLGESNHSGAKRLLAVSTRALTMNLRALGPPGTGKTTLAKNMAVQGMERGDGLAFFDPHGDAIRDLTDLVPKHRINDVVLFDITDPNPLGYNPLAGDPYKVMSRMMAAADGLFDVYRMPRTADLLRNVILTLAYNGRTLIDVSALLEVGAEGQALRREFAAKTPNASVQNYWRRYGGLKPGEQLEITEPLLRRLRPFEFWPNLRACVGQAATTFSLKEILATNKILLVSLSKGQGEKEPLYLVGSMLMAELWDEIQARARLDVADRTPFIIYLDEFHNWVNGLTDFSEVLNENRKYGAGFVLLHQQISQIKSLAVREAAAMSTRSKLTLQTGFVDAAIMARELGKPVTAEDIQDLGPREAIVTLMAGDHTSAPATMRLLPPPEPEQPGRLRAAAVRAASQARYGRPKEDVDYELEQFQARQEPKPEPSLEREEDW
jgi:hypothetical protein